MILVICGENRLGVCVCVCGQLIGYCVCVVGGGGGNVQGCLKRPQKDRNYLTILTYKTFFSYKFFFKCYFSR